MSPNELSRVPTNISMRWPRSTSARTNTPGASPARFASFTKWQWITQRRCEPESLAIGVRAGAKFTQAAQTMTKLRVHCFSISLDGYGAGPNQNVENPLGVGGVALHEWAFATRTFQKLFGNEGGATGLDDDFAARGFSNIGAWIIGRNMFGPIREEWPDDNWKGWWGDKPPYHTSVFVLTHHPRASITMAGGTTFHFITDGI